MTLIDTLARPTHTLLIHECAFPPLDWPEWASIKELDEVSHSTCTHFEFPLRRSESNDEYSRPVRGDTIEQRGCVLRALASYR